VGKFGEGANESHPKRFMAPHPAGSLFPSNTMDQPKLDFISKVSPCLTIEWVESGRKWEIRKF